MSFTTHHGGHWAVIGYNMIFCCWGDFMNEYAPPRQFMRHHHQRFRVFDSLFLGESMSEVSPWEEIPS